MLFSLKDGWGNPDIEGVSSTFFLPSLWNISLRKLLKSEVCVQKVRPVSAAGSQRGAGTHARKAGQPSRGAKVPEEATGRGCTQHGRNLASLGKWFHTAGLSKYVRNIRRQVSHIARELEL